METQPPTQHDKARLLIDQIAVAIEGISDRQERYDTGRALLLQAWNEQPRNMFVLETATAYLMARCDHEWD